MIHRSEQRRNETDRQTCAESDRVKPRVGNSFECSRRPTVYEVSIVNASRFDHVYFAVVFEPAAP